MIILPAIDLKGGKCVRLQQGRADDETVYSEDPIAMAGRWEDEGADYLHVVDLDGAFQGHPVHADVIAKIVDAIDTPVEVGGGLREDADIKLLLDAGVRRVILGTRAFADVDSLKELTDRYGDSIVVGIDARDGMVQVSGWVEATSMSAIDLAVQAEGMGVQTIIYTDIATDGMMTGVNADAVGELCAKVSCNVIASGGVTTKGDIQKLRALSMDNLYGAIVGKALYEGNITLAELKGA